MWDYERGYIICSDCGTVLDTIYYFHLSNNPREEQLIRNSKKVNYNPSISKHTKTYLKLIRKALEYGLEVDNEVFAKYSLGHSPLVKVFKKPEVNLNKLISDESVKMVLDVMKKYPKLASRTDRAKIALAKIALSMVSENELDIKKLSHELRISEVHMRRLYRVVVSEFEFLKDVRRTLTSYVGEVNT
ncbi:MAG: TFIIB-type zinc ribbon-containing protein [Sulfolobales archaeon]